MTESGLLCPVMLTPVTLTAHSCPLNWKAFFEPEIQAEIIRKAHAVRGAHQLLLLVHDAERKSRAILQKPAEQESPNRNRRPTRRNNPVRRIP